LAAKAVGTNADGAKKPDDKKPDEKKPDEKKPDDGKAPDTGKPADATGGKPATDDDDWQRDIRSSHNALETNRHGKVWD
jgi:hypothetical protein